MPKCLLNLDELVGHSAIVSYLSKHIKNQTIPDKLLFVGEPGVGKTSAAKILACEVNKPFLKPEEYQALKQKFILESQNMDCAKLFDLSVLRTEDALREVLSEMNVSFSRTGRKVLILDEAHGLSKEYQDTLLVELDRLQKGVYIFCCTTEMGSFREAFASRFKRPLRFNELSKGAISTVIKDAIQYQGLTFNMSLEFVVAILANYAGNQPRKALNLIESFVPNSIVNQDDLEVSMNLHAVPQVLQLIKYFYTSLVLGINFIEGLKLDNTFLTALIEVLKVSLGGSSPMVNKEQRDTLRQFMSDKDNKLFARFVAEFLKQSNTNKRSGLLSAFILNHVSLADRSEYHKIGDYRLNDQKLMRSEKNNASAKSLGISTSEVLLPALGDVLSDAPKVNF